MKEFTGIQVAELARAVVIFTKLQYAKRMSVIFYHSSTHLALGFWIWEIDLDMTHPNCTLIAYERFRKVSYLQNQSFIRPSIFEFTYMYVFKRFTIFFLFRSDDDLAAKKREEKRYLNIMPLPAAEKQNKLNGINANDEVERIEKVLEFTSYSPNGFFLLLSCSMFG